ncbi:MAG: protein phosphatase 2C domain-containing protein [Gammaproteobacteria bacterium]|jgi:serine/threonine protein phosphatase PrpC
MAMIASQPRLYLGEDLEDVEDCRIGGGTACVYTHRAPHKESANEDSAGIIPCGDGTGVLVIADGLGGLPAGSQASAQAVRQLSTAVTGSCRNHTTLREAILDGIEQGNTGIIALGLGAATTIAVVEIDGREVRPYHAGDSMILVTGQRGRIKHQTLSHAPVAYAVEAGLVHTDDAIYHEDRHLISNMIGAGDMRVEIGPRLKLAPRDTLLVASDGLFDNLQVQEIVDIIRRGPLVRAASELARQCRDRMLEFSQDRPHKPDDLSFILYRPDPH